MTAIDYSLTPWDAVLQECFSKNHLHRGIQSAVDSKLQEFKPFKKKLQLRALHFEQIWHQSVEKPQSYVHAEKLPTDGQTAFHLYIVDVLVCLPG